MPELGIWHSLGILMRKGLVQPWYIEDMTPEMVIFYIGELETEAKIHKAALDKAKADAIKLARRR